LLDTGAQANGHTGTRNSFAKVQRVQHLSVAGLIVPFEVVKQPAPTADHLEEALAGMNIFLVALEMLSQGINALCQESDLDRGRPCVALVPLKLLDEGAFLRSFGRHVSCSSILLHERLVN